MSRAEVCEFLRDLDHFSPADALRVLESPPNPNSGTTVAAAATWLCALATGGPRQPQEHWEVPLEQLATSRHPAAALALKLVAERAAHARVRIGAIQRLGRVSARIEVRTLLHSVAREGCQSLVSFQGDRVNEDEPRVAALQAIGDLSKPTRSDGDVILDVIEPDVKARTPSARFSAATETLSRIARPGHVDAILGATGALNNTAMALDLLGVCSKFDRRVLVAHSDNISTALCGALRHLRRKNQLCERLCALSAKLSSTHLLSALVDGFQNEHFDTPIGAVIHSAVAACEPADESLTEICLRFAMVSANAAPNASCVHELARCAAAGQTRQIMRTVARTSAAGYDTLLTSGALLSVVESPDRIVDEICMALSGEPVVRDQRVLVCSRCVLSLSLNGLPDPQAPEVFERDRAAGNRDFQSSVAAVRDSKDASRPMARVARCLLAESTQQGAAGIAGQFVSREDEFAALFLTHMLRLAAGLGPKKWIRITSTGMFQAFEDSLFPRFTSWLRDNYADSLFVGEKLNRYLLSLLHRRNIEFIEAARCARGKVCRADDADYLFELLTDSPDEEPVQLLCEFVDFVSEDKDLTHGIRRRAMVKTTAMILENPDALSELASPFLTRVHNRFQDVLDVRLAAYDCAGKLAHPQSIVPLRQREDSESDARARQAIARALRAVRTRLVESAPSSREPVADIISWIGHVANLQDEALSGELHRYLEPLHPDSNVVVASLDCLGQLRKSAELSTIEQFIRDTAPGGNVLRAARKAKIALQDRNDTDLFEALANFFEEDSPVLDPDINYEDLLGARTRRLAVKLREVWDHWATRHWDDFVTHLDGCWDMLVRHLFERRRDRMGLDSTKARALAKRDYGNRLQFGKLREAFPALHPGLVQIHNLRNEARSAHPEDADGEEKPGLTEAEAKLAMDQFRHAFPRYIDALR